MGPVFAVGYHWRVFFVGNAFEIAAQFSPQLKNQSS